MEPGDLVSNPGGYIGQFIYGPVYTGAEHPQLSLKSVGIYRYRRGRCERA